MYPTLLIADIAMARNRDLLAEAQQHRRSGLGRPSQSIQAVVRATSRRVGHIRTSRAVPESAAA